MERETATAKMLWIERNQESEKNETAYGAHVVRYRMKNMRQIEKRT